MTGNKSADSPLAGRDLERAILDLGFAHPEYVVIEGPPAFVADVLASAPDTSAGRRFAVEPATWPAKRAQAAAAISALGQTPSQARIAKRLGLSERTVRNYDSAARQSGTRHSNRTG